ncbi:MAG: iron uptake transporter deferrochelatase/peroxidase subunit [Jatrophihabitans sp.]
MSKGFSRRSFLTGALGTAAAAGAGTALAGCDRSHPAAADRSVVAFRGTHQAGIATPAQDRLAFAAFDVTTSQRSELIDLLRRWTAAAELMTRGEPIGPVGGSSPASVPVDTGEASGLPAANLTITVGFGPSLFDKRFGLAGREPLALQPLPAFKGDELEPALSGGDICIQACADDPQVAFHAVRNLNRMGFGVTAMRYFQLGFGRTSSTSQTQQTPRNLLGFKDGTKNVVAEDAADMTNFVWVGAGGDQEWLQGGSYLVSRRIRMEIESWDRDRIGDQQDVIGRFKSSGAPLTGSKEHDLPDLAATSGGTPTIPAHAHIRLASPDSNDGAKILRRGYSFTDGIDQVTGQLDAGLFFICYQSDPSSGFVKVQRTLASDALNEYITHTSSGLFACPPGVAEGEYWGQRLFS